MLKILHGIISLLLKDDTSRIIGIVCLNHIHFHNRTGEFGITLADDEYRGKGFGKDILLTIINYGFKELNLNRIWCEVYSNNNSIHLYKKLGFVSEGILREHVYKNGKYLDSIIIILKKNSISFIIINDTKIIGKKYS